MFCRTCFISLLGDWDTLGFEVGLVMDGEHDASPIRLPQLPTATLGVLGGFYTLCSRLPTVLSLPLLIQRGSISIPPSLITSRAKDKAKREIFKHHSSFMIRGWPTVVRSSLPPPPQQPLLLLEKMQLSTSLAPCRS